MPKPRILLQLDTDSRPSAFDAIVAVDSGVDHLLRYGGVTPETVRDLVYGAMFTRGPDNLQNTAIFIGGSKVDEGEALLEGVVNCFFGSIRVSVMLDPNGANTTASAAVSVASRHVPLLGAETVVLAATGPVGRRVVRLLAQEGAKVRVASRNLDRARAVCGSVMEIIPDARLSAVEHLGDKALASILDGAAVVVAAGTSGIQLLPAAAREAAATLRVAIDLNAVPPVGIEGVAAHETAVDHGGCTCYGAIGVGGQKMKIHKAAIQRLFTANDLVLDAEEIHAIAEIHAGH